MPLEPACWNVLDELPMLKNVVQPKVEVRWMWLFSAVPNAVRLLPE